MWLPDQVFKTVISSTPLISIDLVVRNSENQVLLGKRRNAPAKGFWFVPGGRVLNNETLDNAFVRLVQEELGIKSGIKRSDANFLGVFEYFYNQNIFDNKLRKEYLVNSYNNKKNKKLLKNENSQYYKYLLSHGIMLNNIFPDKI